jgi:hypothetical protein
MRSGRAYTIGPATGVATPFGAVTFNKLADTGPTAVDRFGIEAESVDFIKIAKTKLALGAGKDDLTIGFTWWPSA